MRAPLHIAVDMRGLEHGWRGIGRYVNEIVRRLQSAENVRISTVRPSFWTRRAPRAADVTWHPANGSFIGSRSPSVVTFHDAIPFRFPAADAAARAHQQGPWLRSIAEAHAFMSNSEFTATEIVDVFGIDRARITVTHLGVDHTVFRPGADAVTLPGARPYVLNVGEHDPHKNTPVLVQAWQRAFPGATPALVLTRAPASVPCGALVRASTGDADLAALYRGALAVAIPSRCEGFGLPLLEAMSCGVPVIAARAGALPEIGADAADWIDDPADADAWTTALRRIAADPDRRAAHVRAGLRRATAFSWDRCAALTLALFERVTHGG